MVAAVALLDAVLIAPCGPRSSCPEEGRRAGSRSFWIRSAPMLSSRIPRLALATGPIGSGQGARAGRVSPRTLIRVCDGPKCRLHIILALTLDTQHIARCCTSPDAAPRLRPDGTGSWPRYPDGLEIRFDCATLPTAWSVENDLLADALVRTAGLVRDKDPSRPNTTRKMAPVRARKSKRHIHASRSFQAAGVIVTTSEITAP
ncbi:hypothetical protein IWZ00DRAFT_296759 [Phyllosticta capitalensis]